MHNQWGSRPRQDAGEKVTKSYRPEWTMGDSWLNPGWLKLMKTRRIIYRQERAAKKRACLVDLPILKCPSRHTEPKKDHVNLFDWCSLCFICGPSPVDRVILMLPPHLEGTLFFRDSQSQQNLYETALENMRYIKMLSV